VIAFPGLFTYDMLISLDERDFGLWERKARVRNVRRKIDELGTVRLAMHGDESFDRHVRDLSDQIDLWEMPKWTDEQVVANWEMRMAELKAGLAKAKG
jgi:hypothetical protein